MEVCSFVESVLIIGDCIRRSSLHLFKLAELNADQTHILTNLVIRLRRKINNYYFFNLNIQILFKL